MKRALAIAVMLLWLHGLAIAQVSGGGASGSAAGPATPSGPAGGSLAGTYPNPTISVIDAGVNASTSRNNLGLGSAALLNQPALNSTTGFDTLEQWQPHALPGTSTVTCNGTSGTYPFEDDWRGSLTANTSLALPAPGACALGSVETFLAKQDAAHTFAVTGTIVGTPEWTIGLSAGNEILLQYKDDGASWFLANVTTFPAQTCITSAGCTGVNIGAGGLLSSNGGTAPTISACGTSPAIQANANCTGAAAPFACCSGAGTGTCPQSTNNSGQILIGSTNPTTSCLITLATGTGIAPTVFPICIAHESVGTFQSLKAVATTTTLTITAQTDMHGDIINYICSGKG